MLNEELFDLDEKDQKIFKLTRTIDAFKKYDAERKEYVKSLEKKIQDLQYQYDDLKSEYDELVSEDLTGKVKKLKTKIQNLKTNLSQCSAKLSVIKHPEILDYIKNHDVQSVTQEQTQINNYRSKIKKDQEIIRSLRNSYKDLFTIMHKEGRFTEAQFSTIKMTLWGLNTRIAHILEEIKND